jgi:hypothetical protein
MFMRLLSLMFLAIDSRAVLGRRVLVVLIDSMIGLHAHWKTCTTRKSVAAMLNDRLRFHRVLGLKKTRRVTEDLFVERIIHSWRGGINGSGGG